MCIVKQVSCPAGKKVLPLNKPNSRRLIAKALVLIKGDEVGSFSVALLWMDGWMRPLISSARACLVAHQPKTLQKVERGKTSSYTIIYNS